MPYEIHPETPQEGVLLRDYFPGMDIEAFTRQMNERGEPMGIVFGPMERMSNSRLALEAGEFAKEHGDHHAFHEAMFRAYFTDCKDIGERQVVLEAAVQAGLDQARLEAALDAGTYRPRLEATTRLARDTGVGAAPTFVIEGYGELTGIHPLDTFRTALRQAQDGGLEPL